MGISNLAGQPLTGLGWYSAWVAIMAAAFGITNIVKFHDPTIGLLWLQWSVLWAVFWLVLAMGVARLTVRGLADADPVLHHLHHSRLPAAARGVGATCRTWAVLVVIAATAAVVTPLAVRSLREAPAAPEQAEAAVPVSVS